MPSSDAMGAIAYRNRTCHGSQIEGLGNKAKCKHVRLGRLEHFGYHETIAWRPEQSASAGSACAHQTALLLFLLPPSPRTHVLVLVRPELRNSALWQQHFKRQLFVKLIGHA